MLWMIYKSVHEHAPHSATSWMVEEANKCGMDAEVLYEEDIHIVNDDALDGIYYRGRVKKHPKAVLFRAYNDALARYFEKHGIRTFNSAQAMRLSRDKFATHMALKSIVPQPKTLYTSGHDYQTITKILGSPFVMKESHAAKGERVWLIEDYKTFDKWQGDVDQERVLYQAFIGETKGVDYRVYVIGRQVIGCVKRSAKDGFLSNYAAGGRFEKVEADDMLASLAVQTAQHVKLDIAGIDFLKTDTGYLLCETNAIAGFRTFYATGINIPKAMMGYIARALKT